MANATVAIRFNAVEEEKEFSHEAIKADYLKKFDMVIDSKDFTGKFDAKISAY